MMLWGKNPLSTTDIGEELLFLTTHSMDCHQKGLSSLDYHPHLGVYCSGGLDRMVRVFNKKKELIKEVKFPQPVSCVSFMNKRGDILVGHLTNVSVVMNADLYLRHVVDVSYPVPEPELDYFYHFCRPVKDKQFWKWKQLEDHMLEGPTHVERPKPRLRHRILSKHLDDSETDDEPDERLLGLHREHTLIHQFRKEIQDGSDFGDLLDDEIVPLVMAQAKSVPATAALGRSTINRFLKRQLSLTKAESRMPAIPLPVKMPVM